MRRKTRIVILVASSLAILSGIVALSARPSQAARPPGPRCECANLDAPVICNGGKIYPNPCVAACFNATGCVPYGG